MLTAESQDQQNHDRIRVRARVPKNINIIVMLEANIVRNFLLTMMLVSVSLPVIYAGYYSVALNGLRGEMRLMLSQILTLQRAFSADSGEYAYFEEFYGAPVKGVSNCQQPQGAVKLGFKIDWCHEKGAVVVRYAYKILKLKDKNGFTAVAKSGSDTFDRSFVCSSNGQIDQWHLDEKGQFSLVSSCFLSSQD